MSWSWASDLACACKTYKTVSRSRLLRKELILVSKMNPEKWSIQPNPQSRSPEMCQGYFQPVKTCLQMFFDMGIMKRHCQRSSPSIIEPNQ